MTTPVYARYQLGEGLPMVLFQSGELTVEFPERLPVPGMAAVCDVLRVLDEVEGGRLSAHDAITGLVAGLDFANQMERAHGR